jgi:hypothetical protein
VSCSSTLMLSLILYVAIDFTSVCGSAIFMGYMEFTRVETMKCPMMLKMKTPSFLLLLSY